MTNFVVNIKRWATNNISFYRGRVDVYEDQRRLYRHYSVITRIDENDAIYDAEMLINDLRTANHCTTEEGGNANAD